ncbi:MAG: hypothetical protein ACFFDP_00070 [Promethearchaeota archaeon]
MDYSLLRFKWSLQALASPADIQLELFPDIDLKVDEMAIEFEQWYELIKRRRYFLTPKQAVLLEDLNKRLDEISGPENLHYWLEETLRTDAIWEQIRDLAKQALLALGWELENPLKARSLVSSGPA